VKEFQRKTICSTLRVIHRLQLSQMWRENAQISVYSSSLDRSHRDFVTANSFQKQNMDLSVGDEYRLYV